MPSKPDLTKARIRWSGATTNPAIFGRVGGVAVRLDPDEVVIPPGTGTGMALSRGPTGARWSLDATGPDGGFARLVDPNSTSGKAFTQQATAGDAYDAFSGVNVHPYYFNTGWDTIPEMDLMFDRIQSIGFRHLRGLGLYSGAVKNDPTFEKLSQWFLSRIHDRNLTRGAGVHPMFAQIGLQYERKWAVTLFESQNSYEIVDADGGEPIFRPLDGPIGHTGQTTFNWDTNIWSQTRSISTGSPMGHIAVEMLTGPNEPDNNRVHYDGTDYGIRWVAQQIKRYRNLRPTVTALEGAEYIDYDTGRIVAGPAKFTQMPTMPFSHFVGPAGWTSVGDYTNRLDGDVGGYHQYWGGQPPMWDYTFGSPSQQTSGQYGWMHNANAVNGALAPGGVRYQRSIPLVVGETGYRELDPGGGERGCPQDVSAEYLLQCVLMMYAQGAKRIYVYRLTGEERPGENRKYRLIGDPPSLTFLASGRAYQNFLALIGWSQPTGSQAVSVPVTWTPAADSFADPNNPSGAIRDVLGRLVVHQDDGFGMFFWRNRPIWNRQSQVRTPNQYSAPRNTTFPVPAGYTVQGVAEPAKNNAGGSSGRTGAGGTPNDGQSYANITNGQTLDPPNSGATAMSMSISGSTATLPMGALTRFVKFTKN